MNINVYLENQIGDQLNSLAKQEGKSRNAIIREAIAQWIEQRHPAVWPEEVTSHKGIKGLPPFEDYRSELKHLDKDPFA